MENFLEFITIMNVEEKIILEPIYLVIISLTASRHHQTVMKY